MQKFVFVLLIAIVSKVALLQALETCVECDSEIEGSCHNPEIVHCDGACYTYESKHRKGGIHHHDHVHDHVQTHLKKGCYNAIEEESSCLSNEDCDYFEYMVGPMMGGKFESCTHHCCYGDNCNA